MSEQLRRGLKLRNIREIGVGPLKGKNQVERPELSQTRGRIEDHSKRAGSHRPPRESSGRGRSPTIMRKFHAQKTTCRQEEVQCRGPWNLTYGQGRTMERSNNSRRHSATARTTRKEGAGGCRVLRGASNRGSNPIRPYTVSKCRGGGHATITWDIEEHWRELRTTKDSHLQRGPPGDTPVVTGNEENPQTEVRSPPKRRNGAAPTTFSCAKEETDQHA